MREDIILKALQHTGEAPDEERFRQEITVSHTGVQTRLAREEETGTREIEPLPHCSFRSASVSLSRFFRPPFGLTHVGWCMKLHVASRSFHTVK